jgi:hypothetical protein
VKDLLLFPPPKRNFVYFCPCHSGRNRNGQRKRILRFVPRSEPRHFTQKVRKRMIEEGCFHCYVCVLYTCINSGADHYSLFLFLTGSLGPTTGNKDKFGRLRSVAVFKMPI